jgi:hypothetical protein
MKFEFVEFTSVSDFLLGVNAYFSAPGLRPFVPLDQYKGFLIHMTSLGNLQDELVMLVFIAKATLPQGTIEFDLITKQYSKVDSITRPDKLYFVITEPAFSTLAERAIDAFVSLKR